MNPTEEIKAKLDIVDIISGYISLQQAGTNFRARCPFHNEKTPSFMVSKTKQIWHCFGCSKGGDVFTFVQEYENLSFPETLKLLAHRANVNLPEYRTEPKENYGKFYQLNQLAAEFYQQKLQEKNPVAEKVRAYLQQRHVDDDAIAKWQLGLSGESWEELYLFARQQGYGDDDIFQAGLTLKKKQDHGFFDRFRKRLMFPLADAQGRVVGFTSRTLSNIAYQEEEPGGKYINSPQTAIYDKSKLLYGWHLAKNSLHQKKYLIVVEGNMDVIAAHLAGTDNTVGVSGTALTIDQIKLIKRYTNNVIFAFDGDTAGSTAALRGIALGWQEDLNLKILVLPAGQDPASLIQADKKLWLGAVKDSLPAMDFYFQKVFSAIDLSRADHKKLAVQKLLPIIKYLQSSVEQIHYLQLLSDKLNIPLNTLQDLFKTAKPFLDNSAPVAVKQEIAPTDWLTRVSEQTLAIAFYQENYLQRLVADIEPEMLRDNLQDLYKKVIIYYTKHQSLKHFLEHGDLNTDQQQNWIRLSLAAEKDYFDLTEKELEQHWQTLLNNLKRNFLELQRQVLISDLQQAEAGHLSELQDNLTHQIHILNKEIHKLQ